MKTAKTILKRIMWLARGTGTMFGLAVMVAVVLGVGTTALAAVPGDPLKLGQRNGIDALTTLVGRANGALLSVENNAPGSKGAPAPALSLNVEAGNPPLVANPESGTARGLSADELDGRDSAEFLASSGKAADADKVDGKDSTAFVSSANGTAPNADKLDGKDSTAFANGTGGKANDADRLDGKDSASFWTGKIYNLGSSPRTGTPFAVTSHGAGPCDPGDAAINGNFLFLGGDRDHQIVSEQLFFDNSYAISWANGPVADTVNANVTCADFPPLR